MPSNSENKQVIQITPPDVSGTADVYLGKSDFDALIHKKGYRVHIDNAIKCPCRNRAESSALPDCRNCGGLGWTYINRYETKLMLQSMNMETKYKEWAEEKIGSVKITCRSEVQLAYMDRVTMIEGVSINQQVLYPINYNREGFSDPLIIARTSFPIVKILEIFAFISSNDKLQRLIEGDDYVLDPSSEVITFNNRFNQYENLTISIRYTHRPSFIVVDFPRDLMLTQQLNRDNGEEFSVSIPVHAVAKRSQYVLDLQNLSGDLLLDNSYITPCVPSTGVISSTTLSNSNGQWTQVIPNGIPYEIPDTAIYLINTLSETLSQQLFPSVTGGTMIAPDVVLSNSNQTFETNVPAGQSYELPDTQMEIVVNGELQQTVDLITLGGQTIIITN